MTKGWKHFTFSFLVLLFAVFLFNRFLEWNEQRDGIYYEDPLFKFYEARDYSIFITLLIYSSIGFFLFYHIKVNKPLILARFVWSYTIILFMRMVALYFVPLYCDGGAVKLIDPVVNTLIYPGYYVARDLFFSGHAALIFSFPKFKTLEKVGIKKKQQTYEPISKNTLSCPPFCVGYELQKG